MWTKENILSEEIYIIGSKIVGYGLQSYVLLLLMLSILELSYKRRGLH